MKHLITLISILFLASCVSDQTDQYDLVISNVNLIDGTGEPLQAGVSIGIIGGKIAAIDTALPSNEKNRIDGSGKFLIPGLFDCHVHTGNFERDFPDLFITELLNLYYRRKLVYK
ncbi:MAG: hypothetical protein R2759_18490 [Bacteroidales bacterium]